MNAAHLHLVMVHLPIAGVGLGLFLISLSLNRRLTSLRQAGLLIWMISSVAIVPTYLSGEEAEEVVEHLPGINEQLIENHEEAALATLVSLISLGALSLVGSVLTCRGKTYPKFLTWAIILAALLSLVTIARTANLGGLIRHSEIRSPV